MERRRKRTILIDGRGRARARSSLPLPERSKRIEKEATYEINIQFLCSFLLFCLMEEAFGHSGTHALRHLSHVVRLLSNCLCAHSTKNLFTFFVLSLSLVEHIRFSTTAISYAVQL